MNNWSTENRQSVLQNEVLTVSEVATFLRVSRVTVWRWCQRGTIPALQIGRSWRIYRDDLLHLLNSSQHHEIPEPVQYDQTPETVDAPPPPTVGEN